MFRIYAIIGMVLLSGVACLPENDTIFTDIEGVLANFPRYFEQAVRETQAYEEQNGNYTNMNLFESHCIKDFLKLFLELTNKKFTALKVIDSWGKLPSGILSGNMYDLGDFDQCLSIKPTESFVPQYCVARVSKEELLLPKKEFVVNGLSSFIDEFSGVEQIEPFIIPTTSNALGLNIGICVPNTCKPERIGRFLQLIQKRVLRNKAVLALVPETCQVKADLGWNLDTGDLICLSFIIFLALIMTASTIYDIILSKLDKNKSPIFVAFSMKTNGAKLFACKKSRSENSMECLNGMRVLSALWVIYAHAHAMTFLAPIFNLVHIVKWSAAYPTTVFLMAAFSVDTFLFLSGLLITYSILNTLKKTNGKINVFSMYLHRYLRLTPIFAVIIFISVTLFRKFGSGPLWFSYIKHGINCDKYWWSALLYIQNYYNADSMCLNHSWYLSVDMQLYIAAPILAYLLYRFGYFALIGISLLVAVCVGWTYWTFTHFELVNQFLNLTNNILETMTLTYFPTHVRMAPWLIGVMFAYFLYKYRGRSAQWSIVRVVVHWVITFAIAAVITYFTYAIQQMTHKSTPVESGIYTPLTRVGWAIFLCLVVYACIQGYGGPVNVFLSLSIWKPLARLTYAIYLVHMPIMLWTAASARRPVYFSSRLTLIKFFGDCVAAILLSIIASLALESPVVNLEKMIFSKKPKEPLVAVVSIKTRRDSNVPEQPTAPANT